VIEVPNQPKALGGIGVAACGGDKPPRVVASRNTLYINTFVCLYAFEIAALLVVVM
jgi:hypothetical protein